MTEDNNKNADPASSNGCYDRKAIDLPAPFTPEELATVEKAFGYNFKEKSWLERAFTHRSAPGKELRNHYERLEFLGDAVLDLTVAHMLLDVHKEAREGDLSKMRAALVNAQTLAGIARKLEIGAFIRLGKGEQASGGAERSSILADVMEAVLGAIFRDGGFEVALETTRRLFGDEIKDVRPHDPKTELQELLHALGMPAPSYTMEAVEGPEHEPTFVSVVLINGEIAGRGKGSTKKSSQQEAAGEALSKLRAMSKQSATSANKSPKANNKK